MLTIAGVGPGNPKYLTIDVANRIKEAEFVIAFGRVGNSIKSLRKEYLEVNRVDEIIDCIENRNDALLLASGDPNFFGIVDYLKRNEVNIKEVLPGISSFQYLMAKLNKSWQDARFISLHGRNESLRLVRDNKLTIVLIDKNNRPSYISNELCKLGVVGNMYIGFNLSYEDEKIIRIKIGEEVEDYSSLGVVVIENEVD